MENPFREMPKQFLAHEEFFANIKYNDWYIDWCTGIENYYQGPFQVRCMECLDNTWVVSWGMLEKVDLSVPSLIDYQWGC